MSNKGFTLIELLAILVLLSILLLLGSSSVTKIIKQNKQDAYDIDMANFIDTVKLWSMDHEDLLPKNNSNYGLTLEDLMNSGYINDDKKNPMTGKEYDKDLLFCIYNVNNTYRYEVSSDGTC